MADADHKGEPLALPLNGGLGLVERLRQQFPDVPYHRDQLHRDAADEIERLRELAEHLRHCRECGETDVRHCYEGARLWNAAMPHKAERKAKRRAVGPSV